MDIMAANGAKGEYTLSIVSLPDKMHYRLISKNNHKNQEIESVVAVRSFWEALTYFNSIGMRNASVELSGMNGDSVQITRKITAREEPVVIHILHTIQKNYSPLKLSYEIPVAIFNTLFRQAEAMAQR